MECDYCAAPYEPKMERQAYCSPACALEMDRECANYTPIDVLIQRPAQRILRAMRWHDWMQAKDIAESVDVPTEDCRALRIRKAHDKALSRMRHAGLIETRSYSAKGLRMGRGAVVEYRLTDLGIRAADLARFGQKAES